MSGFDNLQNRLWKLQGKWLASHEPALARAFGLTPDFESGKTSASGPNQLSVCKPAAPAGVQLTHTELEVVRVSPQPSQACNLHARRKKYNDTPAGSHENSSAVSVAALSLGNDAASLSSDGEAPRHSKFHNETSVTPALSALLGLADSAPLGPGPSTSQ